MRNRGSEISDDKEGREEDTEVCWEWRRRGLLGDRQIREKGGDERVGEKGKGRRGGE